MRLVAHGFINRKVYEVNLRKKNMALNFSTFALGILVIIRKSFVLLSNYISALPFHLFTKNQEKEGEINKDTK